MGGDFVEDGVPLDPAEIQSRLQSLESAYKDDYKDFGFKLDGIPTHHYLTNDAEDNLSGNYVAFRSWDQVLPTEWANTRSFSVAVEAVIKSPEVTTIDFKETTTKVGTGGPLWRLYTTFNGEPIKEIIADQTPVTHVTRGRIITMDGFAALPDPYWPDEEEEWRREVVYTAPLKHGRFEESKLTHYTVDYVYYFRRLGPDPMTNFNAWYT